MMSIDRLEGDYAVCQENGMVFHILRELLPAGAKEGDLLRQGSSGYEIDYQGTQEAREETAALLKNLVKRK